MMKYIVHVLLCLLAHICIYVVFCVYYEGTTTLIVVQSCVV